MLYVWSFLAVIIFLSGCTTENGVKFTFASSNTPKVSVTLANNAQYTNQRAHTVNITPTAEVTEMSVQVGQNCGNIWVPYNTSQAITLSTTEGKQRIFVKVRTADGFESSCEKVEITYDVSPPQFSGDPVLENVISLTDQTPRVTNTRAFDTISPIVKYELQLENANSGAVVISSVEKPQDLLNFTGLNLTDSATDIYRYTVRAQDAAGNVATRTSSTFEVGPFITIEPEPATNLNIVGNYKVKLSRLTNRNVTASVLGKSASALNGFHYYHNDFVPISVTVPAQELEQTVQYQIFTGRFRDNAPEKSFNIEVTSIENAAMTSNDPTPVTITAELVKQTGNSSAIFTDLSAHWFSTCGISNGEIYCWGQNDNATVITGRGRKIFHNKTDFTKLSQGTGYYCAIDSNKDAYCWGSNNNNYQLGFTGAAPSAGVGTLLTPVPVSGGQKFKKITTSSWSSCGVTETDKVFCWGFVNVSSNPTTTSTPIEITAFSNVIDVASAGSNYTCVLFEPTPSNRAVRCWGVVNGTYRPSALISFLPNNIEYIMAGASGNQLRGEFACGVTTDKRVYCWGDNKNGRLGYSGDSSDFFQANVINGLPQDIQSLSLSDETACVISQSQGSLCWGHGKNLPADIITYSPTPYPLDAAQNLSVVKLVGTPVSTCGLLSSGRVKCWGNGYIGTIANGYGVPDNAELERIPFPIYQKAKKIISLNGANCLITIENRVRCWGINLIGQLGTGSNEAYMSPTRDIPGLTNVQDISGTNATVCALTTTGQVFCWGNNQTGMIGTNTSNGVTLDPNLLIHSAPKEINLPAPISKISVQDAHACAVDTNRLVYCWGANNNKQLGRNTALGANPDPVVVAGLTDVTHISAGTDATCAITANRNLYCWGKNAYHTLGAPTEIPQLIRNIPGSGEIVLSVGVNLACYTADGEMHCLAITGYLMNGHTFTAGFTTRISFTVNGEIPTFTSVSAGFSSLSGKISTGELLTWNNYNQMIVDSLNKNWLTPPNLSSYSRNPQQCAISLNQEVFCWGQGQFGQASKEFSFTEPQDVLLEP